MVYEEFGLCGFPASVGQECPTHTSTAARKEHGVVEAGEGREVKAGRGCLLGLCFSFSCSVNIDLQNSREPVQS